MKLGCGLVFSLLVAATLWGQSAPAPNSAPLASSARVANAAPVPNCASASEPNPAAFAVQIPRSAHDAYRVKLYVSGANEGDDGPTQNYAIRVGRDKGQYHKSKRPYTKATARVGQ